MSYRLTFFEGFDRATDPLSDDQINQLFDALTELTQEAELKAGTLKIDRDVTVRYEVVGETLTVTGVDIRSRP